MLKTLRKSQAVRNAYEHMKITPHKGVKNLRKQNNTSTPPSSCSFSLRLHFPWLLAQLLRELFLEAAVYFWGRAPRQTQASQFWAEAWQQRARQPTLPTACESRPKNEPCVCVRESTSGQELRKVCQTAEPVCPRFMRVCMCLHALLVRLICIRKEWLK